MGLSESFVLWANAIATQIFYLATLPVQLRKSRKWQARYGADILSTATKAIENWSILDLPVDQSVLQYFAGIAGVDAGEATLYASLETSANAVILTGDKRCLHALAAAPMPQAYRTKIADRSYCFEQILESMMTTQGFQAILNAITTFQGCDKTIEILFSQGQQTSEENVRSGLQSYINNLKRSAPGILGDDF